MVAPSMIGDGSFSDRLSFAIGEAGTKWSAECELHRWFNTTSGTEEADLERFRDFLNEWSLDRNIVAESKRAGARAEVLNDYVRRWRAPLRNAHGGERSYAITTQHSAAVRDLGLTPRGRQCLSLVSKMAFHTKPAVFQPYDKMAVMALRHLGCGDTSNDYIAYMTAFHAVRRLLEIRCASTASLASEKQKLEGVFKGFEGALMSRITDKYLWKLGKDLESRNGRTQ
jgi:hypothetical protein